MSEHLSHPEKVDEKETSIERVVPISNPEVLGISAKKDNSAILLELGYIKNDLTKIQNEKEQYIEAISEAIMKELSQEH